MLGLIEEKHKGPDQKTSGSMSSANFGGFRNFAVIVTLSSFTFVALIGSTSRTTSGAQAPSNTTSSTLTLLDQVEHLPAPSWKAIPLNVSKDGIISIEVKVLRGNAIDVFLTPPDQLEKIKKGEWTELKTSEDIKATRTPSYQHTGRLAKGKYYLVLSDMSAALPSSAPSDISAKVQLRIF